MKQSKPTIIKPIYLSRDVRKAQVKYRLYHAINALTENKRTYAKKRLNGNLWLHYH